MAALSNYLESALVDHIFRGTAFSHTTPASFYVALYTAAPSDAGGGTEVTIGANNYARVAVTRAAGSWAATDGSNGVTSNVSAITFPTPSGSWGTVTHFGILDASSAGNLLFHGALTVQQTINTGNTVSFSAGQLQITFA